MRENDDRFDRSEKRMCRKLSNDNSSMHITCWRSIASSIELLRMVADKRAVPCRRLLPEDYSCSHSKQLWRKDLYWLLSHNVLIFRIDCSEWSIFLSCCEDSQIRKPSNKCRLMSFFSADWCIHRSESSLRQICVSIESHAIALLRRFLHSIELRHRTVRYPAWDGRDSFTFCDVFLRIPRQVFTHVVTDDYMNSFFVDVFFLMIVVA